MKQGRSEQRCGHGDIKEQNYVEKLWKENVKGYSRGLGLGAKEGERV